MGLMDFVGNAALTGSAMLGRQNEIDEKGAEQERLARIQADLQADMEKTRLQLREEFDSRKLQREQSPEAIQAAVNADTSRAKLTLEGKRGLIDSQAKLDSEQYDAGAELRKKTADDALNSWKSQYQAKSAVELDAEVKKLNDPKYLAGKAKETRAGHIDDNAGLRNIQIEAAKIALEEQKAIGKMPPAVKQMASAYQEQLKSLSATIDKGTLENTATPDGLKALEEKRTALSNKLSETLAPYMGNKVAAGATATKQTEQQAQADAQNVVSAGKISMADANKRLQAAGFKPLVDPKAPSVAGRELYNVNISDLKRTASKPRGVSTSEANAAQAEIDARQGEQRMKAF